MARVTKRKRTKPSADRILAAAERVFVRVGYGEASLRQVMTEAKVSTTAFYARFDSKEAVLRALVLGLLAELTAVVARDLAPVRGLEQRFQRGVELMCEVLVPRRALVRITLTEAAASPAVTKSLAELYSTIANVLAAQIGATVVDANAVAWSLVGALHMQVLRWAVYDQLDAAEFEKALHAVADSYLPALRSAHARSPRR